VKEAKGTELVALYNLIGLCYYTPSRLDDALKNYEESARLAEQFGDERGRASALGYIGMIYSTMGEPDMALKCYEEALAIAREIGYQQGVAANLGNIGGIYSTIGELDKALEYHEEALAMHRESGHQQGVAADLGNIGHIYDAKGEPDKALKYYEGGLWGTLTILLGIIGDASHFTCARQGRVGFRIHHQSNTTSAIRDVKPAGRGSGVRRSGRGGRV
jgi:tetratricopeptide (TPR) repeat protein